VAEDLGEKTEDASARKLQTAREQGQLAKSTDLSSAIDLIAVTIGLAVLGTFTMTGLTSVMRRSFEDSSAFIDPVQAGPMLWKSIFDMAYAVGPFLGIALLGSLVAQYMQVGVLFTSKPLEPKLDRLDPIAGFKRLFDRKNLVKTLLNSVKLVLVLYVAYLMLMKDAHKLVSLAQMSAFASMKMIGQIAIELAIVLLVLLLIIGVVDYEFQKWTFNRDQRMSKHDVKEERHSMDGDPEVKARRYRFARQIAVQRVNSAVPRADVIVTNPTHFAVALRYDTKKDRAPIVVAKGADEMAHVIRRIAMVHRVPIVERPPLARALYAGVPVGREIAPEFYQAVAEILAYVYRLDRGVANTKAAQAAARDEIERQQRERETRVREEPQLVEAGAA